MKFNKPKKVKNKENAQRIAHYHANKDRILKKQKETYQKNILIKRKQEKERRKDDVYDLTDRYVKQVITRHSLLTFNDIFDELVQGKRQEIQVKRLLKEEEK